MGWGFTVHTFTFTQPLPSASVSNLHSPPPQFRTPFCSLVASAIRLAVAAFRFAVPAFRLVVATNRLLVFATNRRLPPCRLTPPVRSTTDFVLKKEKLSEENQQIEQQTRAEEYADEREMLSQLSKRCFCTAIQLPRPWLFVGLGNPGDKFKGTRHNVGFNMIDAFAESQGIAMDTAFCKAIFGKGVVDGVPVLLAKPQTYMNLSGESSGPLAAYYKLPLNRVVVFHDDMELPCGVLRLQPKGGHGSHNGLKSVIYHFRGNREFPRMRIGIGKPPGQMDPKAFLLQKFNATAQARIDVALNEGVVALRELISKGLVEASRHFNTEQKYKHLKLQTVP